MRSGSFIADHLELDPVPVEEVESPARLVVVVSIRFETVVAATLAEPGCRAYSYAEDVTEPGLIRVMELWDSREALAAHFEMPHMREWVEQRNALGFSDRDISLYELGAAEKL